MNAQPDLEVVGICCTGMAALMLVHELQPDVLVVDQDISELDGIQVAAHLEFAGIEIRVVLYTVHDPITGSLDEHQVLDDESADTLMTAIRRPRAALVPSRAN